MTTKKHCHICNGRGVKVAPDLRKITCPRCNGTGKPQPIMQRKRQKTVNIYYDKNAGMSALKLVKGE